MRIAFVGPVPPISGGIAQHSARLVATLRDDGHTVDVLSWRAQYPRLLYKGSQARTGETPPAGTRWILRWWSPMSWLRAGRRAGAADLVVVAWVTPVLAVPLWVLLLAARARPVIVVHNALPHEPLPFDRALARLVLRRARGFVAHASTVAADLAGLAPGIPTEVTGMPPLLEIAPTPLPPRPPLRLLFLGYVRPYKGVDVVIEAMPRVRASGVDVRLTVAGDFWEPADGLRALAREHGVEDAVDLRDAYVPDDEVGGLLADHHVLIAPYRSATQSGVIPLAYAAGRTVVTTDVGGLREAVDDGVTGVVAPPSDPAALAAAIERAAADLDRLTAHAAAAAPRWAGVAAAVEAAAAHPPAGATVLDRVSGWAERLSGRRRGASGQWATIAAVVLFAGATYIAFRSLPDIEGGLLWWLLAADAAWVVWGSVFDGAEYRVTAAILRRRVRLRDSMKLAILAHSVNLLPIPGAVLVRTQALKNLGATYKGAIGSTAVVGVGFAGVATALTGLVFAVRVNVLLGAALAAAGCGALAVVRAALLRRHDRARAHRLFLTIVVVETGSVVGKAMRIAVVVKALRFDISIEAAAALTFAVVVTLAVGIFPGGLGLREVLSAALSPLVGLDPAIGTIAAAVDRVIGLSTLALTGAALLVIERLHPSAPVPVEPAAEEVTP